MRLPSIRYWTDGYPETSGKFSLAAGLLYKAAEAPSGGLPDFCRRRFNLFNELEPRLSPPCRVS